VTRLPARISRTVQAATNQENRYSIETGVLRRAERERRNSILSIGI